ncbi:hypothetical protein ACFQFC_17080 [Amorphoplanes digitatis]|uniref:Uncharacterized protein n=1 Tax=Actinoplanes digitatis TaxID=1868 RepID=A0A7W7I3T8_9ACTN|nr:hypothetical protein [Actinoplanes digitatis]MBB4765927.1 hypothetical protein [Actinoplanes digitatis]BFE75882.1 hypothetical protein GCM10020092_091830 [Actinoplanes digitatis]GID93279.1 hypothetical protein Adi01nite_26910 [Actinoplanes digitatis]
MTQRATQQLKDLQKDKQKKVLAFLRDLEARGCAALSYRLTGTEPLDRLCDKHLGGSLRAVVAFESQARAWLILVGDHDDADAEFNVYYELYRLVGHAPTPSEKRTKPPCCGEGGSAPAMGDVAEDLALRAMRLRKTRRR